MALAKQLRKTAQAYQEAGNISRMLELYQEAILLGDGPSALEVGLYYQRQDSAGEEMENHFLRAIELKHEAAIPIYLTAFSSDEVKIQALFLLCLKLPGSTWLTYFQTALPAEQYQALLHHPTSLTYPLIREILGQQAEDETEKEGHFRAGVELGSKLSAYYLAKLYHAKDQLAEAEQYYRQAIALGHGTAYDDLYQLLYETEDERMDVVLQEGAEAGLPTCLHEWALKLIERKEDDLAEQYLQQGTRQGHVECCNSLGVFYSERKREEEALPYFVRAMEAGHVVAMYNLGDYYKNKKDNQLMMKYFELAAEAGETDAMWECFEYYRKLKITSRFLMYGHMLLDRPESEKIDHVRTYLGHHYYEKGEFDLAIPFYLLCKNWSMLDRIYLQKGIKGMAYAVEHQRWEVFGKLLVIQIRSGYTSELCHLLLGFPKEHFGESLMVRTYYKEALFGYLMLNDTYYRCLCLDIRSMIEAYIG